jgi:acyl carrier protein
MTATVSSDTLATLIKIVVNAGAEGVRADRHIADLGLDSLAMLDVGFEIECAFDVDARPWIDSNPTVRELADLIDVARAK